MILLTFLSFALHAAWVTSGAPILEIRSDTDSQSPKEFDTNYRSALDIFWTCSVTIFACTWVTVHPNVRGYRSTWKERVAQRVELMVWALFAPEVMVMWAFRQWLGAREITCKIQEELKQVPQKDITGKQSEWTIVHSHFLQMGGYIFKKDGILQCIDVCSEKPGKSAKEAMAALLQRTETEDEINDRSKGDALAKAFTLLQTLWFVTQCVARGVQGLVITELEVTTLAYALLNGMMYFFWWHKPLDVQCPIVISLSSASQSISALVIGHQARCGEEERNRQSGPGLVTATDEEPKQESLGTRLEEKGKTLLLMASSSMWGWMAYWHLQDWPYPIRIVILFLLLVVSIPELFLSRLKAIYEESRLPQSRERAMDRLAYPTFYAYALDSKQAWKMSVGAGVTGSSIASVFGAIHCIAWSFTFPTPTAQLLWRIASIYICVSPLLLPIAVVGIIFGDRLSVVKWLKKILLGVVAVATLLGFASYVLYIPARVILVALTFIELRHLPREAHQTVEWDSFLPHV